MFVCDMRYVYIPILESGKHWFDGEVQEIPWSVSSYYDNSPENGNHTKWLRSSVKFKTSCYLN